MPQTNFSKKIALHGQIIGNIWHKTIRGSAHLLRKPPAIAFDVDDLTQAEQAGAVGVDVFDCESGTHYKTALENIRAKGFDVWRGFGQQIGLPLHAFSRVGPNLPDLTPPAPATDNQPAPRPAQLSLFGG